MAGRVDPDALVEALDRKIRSRVLAHKSVPPAWYKARQNANDLRLVIDWCRARGIMVEYADLEGRGGEWHVDTSMIYLEARTTARARLFTLLHECGHALIDRSPSDASEHRFGSAHGALIEGPTQMDKINILACEIEAWKRGWSLAERLGLSVSKEEYETDCARAVRTYMNWALSKRRKL